MVSVPAGSVVDLNDFPYSVRWDPVSEQYISDWRQYRRRSYLNGTAWHWLAVGHRKNTKLFKIPALNLSFFSNARLGVRGPRGPVGVSKHIMLHNSIKRVDDRIGYYNVDLPNTGKHGHNCSFTAEYICERFCGPPGGWCIIRTDYSNDVLRQVTLCDKHFRNSFYGPGLSLLPSAALHTLRERYGKEYLYFKVSLANLRRITPLEYMLKSMREESLDVCYS